MKNKIFENHVKIICIFFTALVIPLISFAIIQFSNNTDIFSYLSYALVFIFVINPIVIILSFCLIKKYPKLPQAVVCTTSLNFLCWIIFLFPAMDMHACHQAKTEQKFLQSYEPIIENIYKYKQENKKFPDRIEQIKNIDKTLKNYSYEKTDQNFILTLKYSNFIEYKYCSDSSSNSCSLFKTNSFESTQVGKWTKIKEVD